MPATRNAERRPLPRRFDELVRMMPPQAIMDDLQHANTVEMVDRLMASARLSAGQRLYLETLVQLVQAYETAYHAVETADITGLKTLRYLVEANEMNASDLARVLDVHPSMGSKILKGDRALTIDHLRKLATRFKISPAALID